MRRIRSVGWIVALSVILIGSGINAASADTTPKPAAFFGIHFVNTGVTEATAEEAGRLAGIEARLVEALTASGRYVFVDTAPVADKIARHDNLAHCNGCDARLAAELGADVSVVGELQKTSNLILSLSIFIRDARTGDLIGGGSADLRGNTDETWTRGIDYILRNRILRN